MNPHRGPARAGKAPTLEVVPNAKVAGGSDRSRSHLGPGGGARARPSLVDSALKFVAKHEDRLFGAAMLIAGAVTLVLALRLFVRN